MAIILLYSNALILTTILLHIGFNKGVHYWEIICPISCANIQVGVVKEGVSTVNANNAKLYELQLFRTSTPRVIGIKLDLIKNQMKFWLNGNLQTAKTKNLSPPGTVWYPCIKLKEKGTQVVFNPFAVDPENPHSIFVRNK